MLTHHQTPFCYTTAQLSAVAVVVGQIGNDSLEVIYSSSYIGRFEMYMEEQHHTDSTR